MNTYSRNAKEKNSHVIQPTKGLSFAVQKPLTCLCCCYNTNKFFNRNEKSHFMMDVIEHFSDFCGRESDQAFYWEKTEHKGGACYLENKSIMHKSPVRVATLVCRYLVKPKTLRHLQISYNAPYLPPNILHKHCFQFLLGRL